MFRHRQFLSSGSCRSATSLLSSSFTPMLLFSMMKQSSSPPTTKKRASRPTETRKESVFISSASSPTKIITPIAATTPALNDNKSNSQSVNNKEDNILQYDDLSEMQQKIVDAALKGENIFITGFAGSGKSRALHAVIEALNNNNNSSTNNTNNNNFISSDQQPSSSSVVRIA